MTQNLNPATSARSVAQADDEPSALRALADAAGLLLQWQSAEGRTETLDPEVARGVLQAMDIACQNPAQIDASRQALAAQQACPEPAPLITADLNTVIRVPWAQPPESLHYVLTFEAGGRSEGQAQCSGLAELQLPGIGVAGYHTLALGGRQITLAIAPLRCYGVADALRGAGYDPTSRLWGLALQIYALRDADEAAIGGLGNFGSLARACELAAEAGADAVAINPVHANFGADPGRYSPYAPSSRLFLNALYIDPAQVFGRVAVRQAIAALGLESALLQLEQAAEVDWRAYARLHTALLRHLFVQRAMWLNPAQLQAYQVFCVAGGAALQQHACFEVLHQVHRSDAQACPDWSDWPAAHRDPLSPEVANFSHLHAGEIDFQKFLQWLAARGLAQAQQRACQAGMAIGLIADLAVGTDAAGSHAWSRQAEIFTGLEVGAPADIYNAQGQAWGIAAFSPRGLQRHGYRAFIEMLRAVFAQAGGLRIDHVLGLSRLWLIPRGASPMQGAYLRFPLDDMMRLIAMESWRAQAIVIGENLGTVPSGFNAQLSQHGLLGMSVMWFERQRGADGSETPLPPAAWSRDAIATTGTHDLHTVAGWWSGRDLEWREQLALLEPGISGLAARRQRDTERQALWQAWCASGAASGPCPGPDSLAPVAAALAYVASSPAPLVLIPLEDLLGLREQPNIPGTVETHPNWRRRLGFDLDTWWRSTAVLARLNTLAAARGHHS